MGRKASDFETIPLCHLHHQGAQGIHHLGKKTWEKKFGAQRDLLARVNKLLGIQ